MTGAPGPLVPGSRTATLGTAPALRLSPGRNSPGPTTTPPPAATARTPSPASRTARPGRTAATRRTRTTATSRTHEDADANGEASVPDPALVTEIAGRIAQIKTAADAAATVLAGDGNLRAALAGLDEIAEQAAQARRSLKAALGGRKTPAARPGGLRDKVLAHLEAHPDGAFTPHEIHKVLGNSSGAIANALDTLVKLGEAELATDKPRRFRRAAKPAVAAPGADGAGSAADSTELAGAA